MVYMGSKSHIAKQQKGYSYVGRVAIDCQVGY